MRQSDLKVLVVGGDGMLGHQLVQTLSPFFNVMATVHSKIVVPEAQELLTTDRTIFGIDVRSYEKVEAIIRRFTPDVVINAVGIIKQRNEGSAAIPCIEINALFPHRLYQMVKSNGGRLIHISTDCVFSGRKGNYIESDPADAEDIYGRSKLLGEVTAEKALTLRTSMIGRELKHKRSLLEWFLKQQGSVHGYSRAVFSGLTTLELARVILRIITDFPDANGLFHVSSEPISKYDLLCLIRDKLNLDIQVVSDDTLVIDRSLCSARFQQNFDYQQPIWETMVADLV